MLMKHGYEWRANFIGYMWLAIKRLRTFLCICIGANSLLIQTRVYSPTFWAGLSMTAETSARRQSYFGLSKAHHGLCGAHLIGERQALLDRGSVWANLMQTFLWDVYKASRDGPIRLAQQAHWQSRYRLICQQGLAEEPAPQA